MRYCRCKNLSGQFLCVVGICTAACSALILYLAWSQNIAHTRRMAADQTRIAMEFNLAVRDYMAEHVRPFSQRHSKGDFIPELMSTSFASRAVFDRVSQRFPGCILKFSSENPRNPRNRAGPQELEIIRYFQEHPEADEWSGLICLEDSRYHANFRARRMTKSCLECHGDPRDAPASLLARYGDEAGFHRKLGDVMALDMVAVPVERFESAAARLSWRSAIVVLVSLTLLLAGVYGAFHLLVRRRLAAISQHFRESLDGGNRLRVSPLPRKGDDEIGQLVDSFNDLATRLSDAYDTLEHRVAKRTHELEIANRDLVREAAERSQAEVKLAEALAEAENANRAKTEFLANVSHEIRTPMTAILGFSEGLLDSSLNETERAQAVATIRRNGEHLLKIINDILDISRVEAGKMTVEIIPCRIDEIVGEVLSSMQVRADAKGIALQSVPKGPVPPVVETDPTRLRQVLVNLVGNAVKFTDEGRVEVAVRFRDGEKPALEFEVIDTGVGMTPDQAETVFMPFMQADNSTVRRFGGTGLGLTLSQRLVRLLGGRLELMRTEQGRGTSFRLTLPVRIPENATTASPGTSPSENPHRPEKPTAGRLPLPWRILLAEDGPDNQRLIRAILKAAGADVTVVDNGRKAVEAALAAPFDAILMDMQMPVLDGYDATRELRAAGYQWPIIAVTAHAMAHDRQKCLDAGCDDYSAKPIVRANLVATIRAAIDRSRAYVPSADHKA